VKPAWTLLAGDPSVAPNIVVDDIYCLGQQYKSNACLCWSLADPAIIRWPRAGLPATRAR